MDYEVMIKKYGGWSSRDTLDKPLTKEEYIEILKADGETSLIKEIEEAESFKVIEFGRYDQLK